MPAIALRVEGTLFTHDERAAFMLRPGARSYVIRLGFILRGSEEVLFPESLLDDWGHEITTLELYDWVSNNGLDFPRAEIFGYDLTGMPGQCFVREVDLMAGYACFVFASSAAAMTSGVRANAILLPEPGFVQPKRVPTPVGIEAPLVEASVEWWVVGLSAARQLGLALLDDLDNRQAV